MFERVFDFISGLRNYNMVPWKPTPKPAADLGPEPVVIREPSPATKKQGWSKKIEDCHERLLLSHPLVVNEWTSLHPELKLQLDYTWRSPEFQFELFKKGRELRNGVWVVVDKKKVVTEKDGTKLSHHNVYPAQAIDVYIKRNGVMMWPSDGDASIGHNHLYHELGKLYEAHGLIAGATWRYSWKDHNHVQVDYKIV